MLLIFFISLIYSVIGQNNCTVAREFNLPTFTSSITFGTVTPQSYLEDRPGFPSPVRAFYFKTVPQESTEIFVSTCYPKTNIPTKIYLLTDCVEDAGEAICTGLDPHGKSGIDPDCEHGFDFPLLTAPLEKGKTYYFAFVADEGVNGDVKFTISESAETNNNIECDVATNIPSVPYTMTGSIFNVNSNSVKLSCYSSATSTRWFKLTGDGRYYVASTCNPYTNFDTFIAVVNDTHGNTKCNGATCARYADEGCGRTTSASAVAFHTIKDNIYYIGVSSADGVGGQYHIKVDALIDTLPIVCEQSLPIQSLPFSYTINIPSEWPASRSQCVYRGQEYKTVYFTYKGEGKQVVLSTCRSVDSDLNAIGVGVEIVDDCADLQCSVTDTEFGHCGRNMFISKKLEKGQNYVVKVFCLDGPCEMTFEMYERQQDHSSCNRAMALHAPETYTDMIRKINLNESAHGCDSYVQFDTGLWYNFIRSTKNPDQTYTIIAGNENKDKSAWIEFSPGCNDIRCTLQTRGEAHLRFDSGSNNQYIFAFINGTEKGMFVYFVQDMMNKFDTCETAMQITLPFTAIHTLGTAKTTTTCGDRFTTVGNYYKFKLDKDIEVDASTCFPKTTFNTSIEFTEGGCSSKKCTGYNLDGRSCELGASKVSIDLKKNVEYVMEVLAENPNIKINIKQYRLVIFTLEIPQNSKCDTPTLIKGSTFYYQQLTLNRLSYATDLGEDLPGTVRGAYFLVEADNDDYTIEVRTCSSNTTTDSFILSTKKCSAVKNGDTYVSYPDDLIDIETSTIKSCDVFGTYMRFNLTKGQKAYVFVGPSNFHDDAFIGVEFFMDQIGKKPDTSSTTSTSSSYTYSSNNIEDESDGEGIQVGWLVICILFYCLFVLILVATIIFIARVKFNGQSYSTLA